MTAQPLLIYPRMPRVVMAQDLLASPAAFDRHFVAADVVDFTELGQEEQIEAVKEYMRHYHFYESKKSKVILNKRYINQVLEVKIKDIDKEKWQHRRIADRSRRDYYMAALGQNDPYWTHKLLHSGNWDESEYQTNLLMVSNPEVSEYQFPVKFTEKYQIRYDFRHNNNGHPGCQANFFVVPDEIISALPNTSRRKILHALGRTMYLGGHDDMHAAAATDEEYLRAGTAALFTKMPDEFRQGVVENAVNALSELEQSDALKDASHVKFWHGVFVYVSQYLFDFDDPLLAPFLGKLEEQNTDGENYYVLKIRKAIWKQLGKTGGDVPARIHKPEQQAAALLNMRLEVQKMPMDYCSGVSRLTQFLPRRMKNGDVVFTPPVSQKPGMPLICDF